MGQQASGLPAENYSAAPSPRGLASRQKLNDYVNDGRIGRGAFGDVYRCHKRGAEERVVALKVMTRDARGSIFRKWRNEAMALRTLKGLPFILQIKDSFQYDEYLYCIVTEFVTGITLDELVHSRPVLHRDEVRFYLAELLAAISILHEKRIIHSDIKPGNILLDAEGHIVLADFGESALLADQDEVTKSRYYGTIEYCSPESVQRKPFNHMKDWWAFAVTAHAIATAGELVFGNNDLSTDAILISIVYKSPAINVRLTKSFQELLRRMLHKDVKDRLGYGGDDDIKSHPFFEPVDWSTAFDRRLKPPIDPINVTRISVEEKVSDWLKGCEPTEYSK